MNREQIDLLLQRFRMGLCTPEEVAAIDQWYEAMAAAGEWNWTDEERRLFGGEVWKGIQEAMEIPETRVRVLSRGWARMAAAAAILIAVLAGGYWLIRERTVPPIAQSVGKKTFAPDVLPGGNKAVLTLADGSHIVLDSAKNGRIIGQQENAEITEQGSGTVVYQPTSKSASHVMVAYNELTTPRGGQYELVLPDGTKVWLNAASSIRYPTAFTGKERRVEVSGEAYFEVDRQGSMPFIVSIIGPSGVQGGEVEVLGTHFNVNAYGDENLVRTTLLNGAIRLVKDGKGILLKPGQQAAYGGTGRPELVKNADVDGAVAWKNGIFQFDEDGIETVMRQVERWYDIEVSYAGKIPSGHFSGTVERKANISQILQILELSDVHFRIDGRRIVILPG